MLLPNSCPCLYRLLLWVRSTACWFSKWSGLCYNSSKGCLLICLLWCQNQFHCWIICITSKYPPEAGIPIYLSRDRIANPTIALWCFRSMPGNSFIRRVRCFMVRRFGEAGGSSALLWISDKPILIEVRRSGSSIFVSIMKLSSLMKEKEWNLGLVR